MDTLKLTNKQLHAKRLYDKTRMAEKRKEAKMTLDEYVQIWEGY